MSSQLWDKQEGDTKASYAAFMDYCRMGITRSIRKLAEHYKKEATKKKGARPVATEYSLFTWSSKNNWQERAEAWDENEQIEASLVWQQRKNEVREADWELAARLRKLAIGILDEAPNFMRTRRKMIKGKGGEPDREIITVGLNMQQALQATKLASELQRLSAQMPDRFMDITSGGAPLKPSIYLPAPDEKWVDEDNDDSDLPKLNEV